MPEVKYTIKAKADLKAVKEAERAVKDLGKETEKTAKKVKEQTKATKEQDRALEELKKSSAKVAEQQEKVAKSTEKSTGGMFRAAKAATEFHRIFRAIFSSLISFAVVTRAVNAIKTIFSPALDGLTTSAKASEEALGRLIASKIKLDGAESAFKSISDTLNSFSEANEKVVISLGKVSEQLNKPDIKAFLAGEESIFGGMANATKAVDQKRIDAFDLQTQEMIGIASARGEGPEKIAAIRSSRASERAGILESMNKRDIESPRDFFNQFDVGAMEAAMLKGNEKAAELARIKKEIGDVAGERIGLEKQLDVGLPGGPQLDIAKQSAYSRVFKLKKREEELIARRARTTAELTGYRQQSLGLSSYDQLGQFETGLDAAKSNIARGVMSDVNMRIAGSESMIGQASSDSRVAAVQQAVEDSKRIEREATRAIEEANKLREKQASLLQHGMSIESASWQALNDRIRVLENRQKEARSQ